MKTSFLKVGASQTMIERALKAAATTNHGSWP